MIRIFCLAALLALVGCADPSKGTALNECRMRYWLDSPDMQGQLIPACMRAKSFEAIACDPAADPWEWDRLASTYPFDNSNCYRSIGPTAWTTTFLSPM
jgi:hypothetical protein